MQRRPDRQAISVAGRAQIQARPKSVSCAAYLMPRHCRVQSVAFRPSHAVRGANPQAGLASRVLLAPSCEGAVRERWLGFSDSVDAAGTGPSPICPQTRSLRTTAVLALDPAAPLRAGPGSCDAGVAEECYLVDPASSHMLVSKIKPCMCKYEQIQTVKLRMAH